MKHTLTVLLLAFTAALTAQVTAPRYTIGATQVINTRTYYRVDDSSNANDGGRALFVLGKAEAQRVVGLLNAAETPAPAPEPASAFLSNWDTGVGTAANVVSDGGRWPNYWEFNGGTNVQLLTVVPGGPNGHNALKVLQRGSGFAANLQIDHVVGESQDFYLRYYMRNDDTSSAGDHVVTVDTYQYPNMTFMRKTSSPTGWTFVSSLYGCGYTYPIGHWGPTLKLTNGAWYRFEYFVHFVDSTHVQMHPRVYDASGALILSENDFKQSDFGSASWNGKSDWTLGSYYAAGNNFCVQPQWVNTLGLGNNGQQFATDTGLAWYFAAVEVRTDRWPGAVR